MQMETESHWVTASGLSLTHTHTMVAHMRTAPSQERAQDKQSELDELRARRYQEAKEREWRAREKAAAERHAAMQAELAEAREAQKAAKMLQRAEMAKVGLWARLPGCCHTEGTAPVSWV